MRLDLHKPILLVKSLRESHGTCLVVDGDQGPCRVDIAVGSCQAVPISVLRLGDIGLGIIVSNLVLKVVHRLS